MKRRQSAGGVFVGLAAVAIATGGMVFAPAAVGAEVESAPTDDAGYQAFVQEVTSVDPAVTAVGQDRDGNIVVSAVDGTLADETVAALESYDNVVINDRPAIQAYSTNDLVGGAGYASVSPAQQGGVCSIGFSGWTPAGGPALITAGHCGPVGNKIFQTMPSADDAPYFPGREPEYRPKLRPVPIGEMSFSQWGGPQGTEGAQGDFDSTDIAAIDVTNPDLALLPMVTDWTTWASEDLSLSGTPVTGVGTVEVGDVVTRSGRSTGVTSGVATGDPAASSATVVESKSWTRVCETITPVPVNCHWVYGFWTDAETRPGDSGGSYLHGTTAVGVLSGGSAGMSFATDLVNGLRLTPGYTIMLDLVEPSVIAPTTLAPGAEVRGTGPAGLTLVVTEGGSDAEVVIAADGTWSFAAPTAPGVFPFTLHVKDAGFNTSDSVPFTLTVDSALLPSPEITSPAPDAVVTGPAVTFSGLGAPSAQIALSGSATGTTTVAADGTWTITENVGVGAASVTVTQTIYGISESATFSFTVVAPEPTPAPPAPADGSGSGGSTLAATGMDAASVAGPAMLGGALVVAAGALLLVARKRANRI